MSEVPVPGPEFEANRSEEALASVTRLPIRPEKDAAREAVDFSEFTLEEVTELFMAELRHPSRSGLRGTGLAAHIESYLGRQASDDITTHEGRMRKLVEQAQSDDSTVEEKQANDSVYRYLEDEVKATIKHKEMAEQRHAALELLMLREAIPSFRTSEDKTWFDVIRRLLT